MKRLILLLFLWCFFFSKSFAFLPKDTSLAKSQLFAGFGLSLFGYTPSINSYISFYWQIGLEYNYSKKIKYGFSANEIKFNWTGLKPDSAAFGDNYDKVKYFSVSSDLQLFGRYILSRDPYDGAYNKYLELGVGYNLPYYFALREFKDDHKTVITYPNKYNDAFIFVTYYFHAGGFPLGVRLEYHPFHIIANNNYPNMPPFRIDLISYMFSENNDRKR